MSVPATYDSFDGWLAIVVPFAFVWPGVEQTTNKRAWRTYNYEVPFALFAIVDGASSAGTWHNASVWWSSCWLLPNGKAHCGCSSGLEQKTNQPLLASAQQQVGAVPDCTRCSQWCTVPMSNERVPLLLPFPSHCSIKPTVLLFTTDSHQQLSSCFCNR